MPGAGGRSCERVAERSDWLPMERTLGSMVRLARGDQFRAVFGVFFVLVGAPAGAQSLGASEEGAIQGEEACMLQRRPMSDGLQRRNVCEMMLSGF